MERLIANSGIQIMTFPLAINTKDKFKLWYHEWNDEEGNWTLEPVFELRTEDSVLYYKKFDVYNGGYLVDPSAEIDPADLKEDDIMPLRIDDDNCVGVQGDVFCMTFNDRESKLTAFENQWLPLPYFFKRTERKFRFGPHNWARFKMIRRKEEEGVIYYDVILAFDTRTRYESDDYNECPVFPDNFCTEINLALCSNEFFVMDYCSPNEKWSYINDHLFKLAHPNLTNISQLIGNHRRTAYIATYCHLISYLASKELFPEVTLYKDIDVETKDIDMVVDIGNSRTTALLIEDNSNFNQVRKLQLIDYSNLLEFNEDGTNLKIYSDPFDMRIVFRRVDFGNFGIKNSSQFVYPSLVRLGKEANHLIHLATDNTGEEETLSTYSSPKRYLWDAKPGKEEWRFLALPGEEVDPILNLKGITNQLQSDGKLDKKGQGGITFHYSRRSLMTFAFLEMLAQAEVQINSSKHRAVETGFGQVSMPRKIKSIIVTCPTAMSKVEREALVKCAKDAVILLENFHYGDVSLNPSPGKSIEVIPTVTSFKDSDPVWYYDEATCSQLVYMYGEVGHKYKGCSSEFFNLYGKVEEGDTQPSITVGSIDIGAGTSDLMISKYSYKIGDITTITPEPKFYDSYYFAGDDMLYALIKNVMILDEGSAFRKCMSNLSYHDYRQEMKNFFGTDYNGQVLADRIARKNFNIQYSIPLMSYFLELLSRHSKSKRVTYSEVFADCPPNNAVIADFKKRTGIDITNVEWYFDSEKVSDIVRREFEPLLKKIATIMFSYACDIVLISGRPASLPVIRDIFLKYYSVSPNRLIVLNDYFVGDWYPFCNNTGYIRDAKTVVAVGGIIGHYATELSVLNKFVIDLEKLREGLKSTVNFVESSRDGKHIEYCISPTKNSGELTLAKIPETLVVRQLGIDSYPARALYCINFNEAKIADRIRKKAVNDGDFPTDAAVRALVRENVLKLMKRMPFKITIERDVDDKENLQIVSVIDSADNEVNINDLEISIQSLGAGQEYWLDSGAFDF